MRKQIDIDSKHSRAIVREIGKGLRESVKEDKDLPANFKSQIERLRQSEGEPVAAKRSRDEAALGYGYSAGSSGNSDNPNLIASSTRVSCLIASRICRDRPLNPSPL
jgi:hypothetical protein